MTNRILVAIAVLATAIAVVLWDLPPIDPQRHVAPQGDELASSYYATPYLPVNRMQSER